MIKKGLMIVLSSPSGGGKTTIAQRLLKRDKNIIRSVSCTTRKPRRGEKNGRDYFFITLRRFKAMAAREDFLESARVHDHFYGTPRRWVGEQMAKGKDVLFVIDVQGGKTIKSRNRAALLIFLIPPSFKVLQKRLEGRGSEKDADLKLRLKNAKWEMREGRRYDYRVVNDRLGKAVAEVAKIIRKERQNQRVAGGG
ncbi:MAG TPA: guanylate kinase [bacterium]|nr:guanylate kinase [bacterium]